MERAVCLCCLTFEFSRLRQSQDTHVRLRIGEVDMPFWLEQAELKIKAMS